MLFVTAWAGRLRCEARFEYTQRRRSTVVAHPCDESSLTGAVDGAKLGSIAPILAGPVARITALAEQCNLKISAFEIVRRTAQPRVCSGVSAPGARRPR